jgi:microcystin-dependent protein
MKRIYFDKGGCDDGCNANANSYEESLRGAQGVQGKQGIQGIDGKSSLINGSVTDGTTDSDGTADDALDNTAKTNLNSMGFNVETDSTLRPTIDTSDTVNKKTWVRLSNKVLNLIGLEIKPNLLPSVGSEGQVLTVASGLWTPQTPVNEIYNTTSVTSLAITESMVGNNVGLSVGTGLAYKFGIPVRATDAASNNNYIEGVVASYSGSTLTFNVTRVVGSGTPASWRVALGSLLNVPYISSSTANKVLINDGLNSSWGDSTIITGFCMPWFSPTLPSGGWLFCNGAPYDIAVQTYLTPLYNLLCPSGTNKFNDGLPAGQFRVPNLTGRVPVGRDSDNANINELGETYGAVTTILLAENLPEVCPYPTVNGAGTSDLAGITPLTGVPGNSGGGGTVLIPGANTAVQNISTNVTMGTNTATGDAPFSNFQPSTVCYWIIKY